jgi:hypothetical protein
MEMRFESPTREFTRGSNSAGLRRRGVPDYHWGDGGGVESVRAKELATSPRETWGTVNEKRPQAYLGPLPAVGTAGQNPAAAGQSMSVPVNLPADGIFVLVQRALLCFREMCAVE